MNDAALNQLKRNRPCERTTLSVVRPTAGGEELEGHRRVHRNSGAHGVFVDRHPVLMTVYARAGCSPGGHTPRNDIAPEQYATEPVDGSKKKKKKTMAAPSAPPPPAPGLRLEWVSGPPVPRRRGSAMIRGEDRGRLVKPPCGWRACRAAGRHCPSPEATHAPASRHEHSPSGRHLELRRSPTPQTGPRSP